MSQIAAEIAQLEQQLTEAEERKQQYGGQDIAQYQKAVDDANNISAKLAQLREQAEKEQREQKKQDTIDEYVDIVSQMFEALFPSEKYRPLFGITEYEEKRAQFYQLNHAYVTEKIEAIHQENELALALKDERYRLLNDQALRVQEQLDEANKSIQAIKLDYLAEKENYNDLIDDYKRELVQAKREAETANATCVQLEQQLMQLRHDNAVQAEQIMTLQEKLEAAQQPKESKPSQKLSDIMNEIKSKNDLKADDWIARWNARQKSDEVKIPLPEINVPELTESPFRNENNTAYAEEYRISPPEVVAPVGGSFQIDEEFTQAGPIEIPTQQPNGEVVAKTVEERLEALERAVFGEVRVA
ncbi:hypothetical protein [Paenibacillus naphthalenovorans]|uniref:hypothetical protein n=1 Tax=Paenibacillus naphthalenovorans TaxID=162209 RepID=UPI000887AEAE|nr:hypothetical protein [Paenibacillus naphthalenovorans]SDJ61262.1 hypothetical protein SAMN05421868_13438 [Paenibacillus naphthalenovorans]